MNLMESNKCYISFVDAEGPVFKHQGVSGHSFDYASMCFQLERWWPNSTYT